MKRIFWVILLLSAYVWSISTGRDQFVLDQGKRLYQTVMVWFEDAEVDFQVKKEIPIPTPSKKKRSRRWD